MVCKLPYCVQLPLLLLAIVQTVLEIHGETSKIQYLFILIFTSSKLRTISNLKDYILEIYYNLEIYYSLEMHYSLEMVIKTITGVQLASALQC